MYSNYLKRFELPSRRKFSFKSSNQRLELAPKHPSKNYFPLEIKLNLKTLITVWGFLFPTLANFFFCSMKMGQKKREKRRRRVSRTVAQPFCFTLSEHQKGDESSASEWCNKKRERTFRVSLLMFHFAPLTGKVCTAAHDAFALISCMTSRPSNGSRAGKRREKKSQRRLKIWFPSFYWLSDRDQSVMGCWWWGGPDRGGESPFE